jgi:hypothetical protein
LKLVIDDWLTKTKAIFRSINLGLQTLDGADMADFVNQSLTTYPVAYRVLHEVGLLQLPSTQIILYSVACEVAAKELGLWTS